MTKKRHHLHHVDSESRFSFLTSSFHFFDEGKGLSGLGFRGLTVSQRLINR